MDNQSYKRLQKMLMHGTSSIEEDDREEDIESEPPRYLVITIMELPGCVCGGQIFLLTGPWQSLYSVTSN